MGGGVLRIEFRVTSRQPARRDGRFQKFLEFGQMTNTGRWDWFAGPPFLGSLKLRMTTAEMRVGRAALFGGRGWVGGGRGRRARRLGAALLGRDVFKAEARWEKGGKGDTGQDRGLLMWASPMGLAGRSAGENEGGRNRGAIRGLEQKRESSEAWFGARKACSRAVFLSRVSARGREKHGEWPRAGERRRVL